MEIASSKARYYRVLLELFTPKVLEKLLLSFVSLTPKQGVEIYFFLLLFEKLLSENLTSTFEASLRQSIDFIKKQGNNEGAEHYIKDVHIEDGVVLIPAFLWESSRCSTCDIATKMTSLQI